MTRPLAPDVCSRVQSMLLDWHADSGPERLGRTLPCLH
jgi:hypothetical protein